MTKTNLEIEEEFNKYFLDCIRRRFGVARFEGDSELLRDDISKYWLSKLQQRKDEIEGEVRRKMHNVEITKVSTKEAELTKVVIMELFKEFLNIIKSVDKNKNNDQRNKIQSLGWERNNGC